MKEIRGSNVPRRQFLQYGAALTTGMAILPGVVRSATAANNKVRVGVIGCGGRGAWIAGLFNESGLAEVVALHDVFQDRVDAAGEKHGVPPERRFTGLDGYHALLEHELDAVAIISPPYFHPEQAVAALAKGKHVYLAKPIAVEVPGCKDILDAAEKVRGNQSVFVDFQTRSNEFFQGAAQRVHEGFIGEPVCGQFFYHTGRLGIKMPPGTEEARLRNWVFDKALSGDIIVEQNIHVLDVANWYLQGHPVKAHGWGGRRVRVDVGDCWDHFVVGYVYANDVLVDFSSTQFNYGFDDLCMRLFCSEGTVESHYGGDVEIRGKKNGWKGGNTGKIYHDGAVINIHDFCTALQNGQTLHNIEASAESTMTSILGRMAAYEQREVTWDEMAASTVRLDPKLSL
ncbi:MAG: Gfo/Idh/MocA family oxidoreductase [Candidatus Hydrogenedentes bacterium]|nr:Gfo/Idh/MocA family oxidoreductase [Candidatus Hydrogenedentota bacterium]